MDLAGQLRVRALCAYWDRKVIIREYLILISWITNFTELRKIPAA